MKQGKVTVIIAVTLIIILAIGCKGKKSTTTPGVTIIDVKVTSGPAPTPTQPYVFKTSKPGTATLHGFLLVMDPMVILPASDDAIFLVPLPQGEVTSIPQFQVGEVPQADVNEITGEFVFTNIEPGRYVVVVLTTGGSQIPPHTMDSKSVVVVTVDSSHLDQTVELGQMRLP
jgi:hypothetical protein